jgi:hypothetical protein
MRITVKHNNRENTEKETQVGVEGMAVPEIKAFIIFVAVWGFEFRSGALPLELASRSLESMHLYLMRL